MKECGCHVTFHGDTAVAVRTPVRKTQLTY